MESNVLGLQDWWLQGPERQVEVEHLRLIGKWVRQKASSLQVLEQLSTQREREREGTKVLHGILVHRTSLFSQGTVPKPL